MDGRFVRGGDTFLALCFKFLKAVYEKSKATRAKDKASILKLKATQKKRNRLKIPTYAHALGTANMWG